MHEIVAGGGNGYVLLDSRPPHEFDGTVMSDAVPKAGHLPGAHSLYWKTLLESSGPVVAGREATAGSISACRRRL